MKREEENALVAEAAAGDKDAQTKLLAMHDRMVWKVATAHAKRWKRADVDDLAQGGRMGLLTAVNRFDASRGCRFITYATHWIANGVKMEAHRSELIYVPSYLSYRSADRKHAGNAVNARHLVSVDEMAMTEDSHPFELLITDARAETESSLAEELTILQKAVDNLDLRLKYVLIRRYFDGQSLRAISESMGITKERVRQLQEQALAKLRTTIWTR